nr:uncharacterized protein LOC121126664 isoform X2 [Lepeophtheirus salmonis]
MRGKVLKGKPIQTDYASHECRTAFFEQCKDVRMRTRTWEEEERVDGKFGRKIEYRSMDAPTCRTKRYEDYTPRTNDYEEELKRFQNDRVNNYEFEKQRNYQRNYSENKSLSNIDSSAITTKRYKPLTTAISPPRLIDERDLRDSLNRKTRHRCDVSSKRLLDPRRNKLTSDDEKEKKKCDFSISEDLCSIDSSSSNILVEPSNRRIKLAELRRLSSDSTRSLDLSVFNIDKKTSLNSRRLSSSADSSSIKNENDSDLGDSSRPGTPLCDEKPENLNNEAPVRLSSHLRSAEPMHLPLPRFAHDVLSPKSTGSNSNSIIHICGNQSTTTSETSERDLRLKSLSPKMVICNSNLALDKPSDPRLIPAIKSPNVDSDLDSEKEVGTDLRSLEERIRDLDEKYQKWSGSTKGAVSPSNVSIIGSQALSPLISQSLPNHPTVINSSNKYNLDLKPAQPSAIVQILLSRKSVFDEDSKRLECRKTHEEIVSTCDSSYTNSIAGGHTSNFVGNSFSRSTKYVNNYNNISTLPDKPVITSVASSDFSSLLPREIPTMPANSGVPIVTIMQTPSIPPLPSVAGTSTTTNPIKPLVDKRQMISTKPSATVTPTFKSSSVVTIPVIVPSQVKQQLNSVAVNCNKIEKGEASSTTSSPKCESSSNILSHQVNSLSSESHVSTSVPEISSTVSPEESVDESGTVSSTTYLDKNNGKNYKIIDNVTMFSPMCKFSSSKQKERLKSSLKDDIIRKNNLSKDVAKKFKEKQQRISEWKDVLTASDTVFKKEVLKKEIAIVSDRKSDSISSKKRRLSSSNYDEISSISKVSKPDHEKKSDVNITPSNESLSIVKLGRIPRIPKKERKTAEIIGKHSSDNKLCEFEKMKSPLKSFKYECKKRKKDKNQESVISKDKLVCSSINDYHLKPKKRPHEKYSDSSSKIRKHSSHIKNKMKIKSSCNSSKKNDPVSSVNSIKKDKKRHTSSEGLVSDDEQDNDNEPKKFSIFDDPVIDLNNPVYFSMYDKVKARRSCVVKRNDAEETRKQQEALLAKFSKLKKKRIQKIKKQSDDETDQSEGANSDSDDDQQKIKKKVSVILSSSSDDLHILCAVSSEEELKDNRRESDSGNVKEILSFKKKKKRKKRIPASLDSDSDESNSERCIQNLYPPFNQDNKINKKRTLKKNTSIDSSDSDVFGKEETVKKNSSAKFSTYSKSIKKITRASMSGGCQRESDVFSGSENETLKQEANNSSNNSNETVSKKRFKKIESSIEIETSLSRRSTDFKKDKKDSHIKTHTFKTVKTEKGRTELDKKMIKIFGSSEDDEKHNNKIISKDNKNYSETKLSESDCDQLLSISKKSKRSEALLSSSVLSSHKKKKRKEKKHRSLYELSSQRSSIKSENLLKGESSQSKKDGLLSDINKESHLLIVDKSTSLSSSVSIEKHVELLGKNKNKLSNEDSVLERSEQDELIISKERSTPPTEPDSINNKRSIISVEETDQAVKALLGESFEDENIFDEDKGVHATESSTNQNNHEQTNEIETRSAVAGIFDEEIDEAAIAVADLTASEENHNVPSAQRITQQEESNEKFGLVQTNDVKDPSLPYVSPQLSDLKVSEYLIGDKGDWRCINNNSNSDNKSFSLLPKFGDRSKFNECTISSEKLTSELDIGNSKVSVEIGIDKASEIGLNETVPVPPDKSIISSEFQMESSLKARESSFLTSHENHDISVEVKKINQCSTSPKSHGSKGGYSKKFGCKKSTLEGAENISPQPVTSKASLDIFDWPDDEETLSILETDLCNSKTAPVINTPPSLTITPTTATGLCKKQSQKTNLCITQSSDKLNTSCSSSLVIMPTMLRNDEDKIDCSSCGNIKDDSIKVKNGLDEIQHKEESIRNIPSGKDFLELKKDNINLVDPETGYLHVMKQSDEGKYIPVQIANRPTAINSSSNMIPGVPTVLTPRLFPKVSPSIQIHPVLSPTNNINHSFNPIPHLEANNVKLTGSSSSNVPSSVVSLLPNQPLPLNTDTHCITDKRTLPLPRLPQVPVPFKLPETSDNVHVVSLKPREVELDKKERIAVEALSSIPRYSKPQSKEEFDQIIRVQQEAVINQELNLIYQHMMSKGHPEHVAMSLASTVLQDRMKSVRQQTSTNDVILTEHVQHRSSLSLPSESFVSNSSCDSPVVLPVLNRLNSTNPYLYPPGYITSQSDNPKTSLPIPEFTFPNLEDYPVVWQGFLGLKNDSATVQFHYVSGCKDLARSSLPPPPIKDGELQMPLLRIGQRMRLEASQLDGVSRKMCLPQEHCILLALPCGKDAHDVELQSRQLRNHLITYLQLKSAAGIVNISNDGETQSAYVVHVFPSCDFANKTMGGIAPDLLARVAEIEHMVIIIATVFDNK